MERGDMRHTIEVFGPRGTLAESRREEREEVLEEVKRLHAAFPNERIVVGVAHRSHLAGDGLEKEQRLQIEEILKAPLTPEAEDATL